MKLKLSAPDFVRRSLSSRLSVLLVLLFGILMLAALDYVFTQTRKGARQEAEGRAEQVLDNTVLRVNGILEDVEIAADNLEWLILRDITDPDKMREYSNEIVRNNAILNSCSVSFEPYFYPEKGRYYSIFSYRGPDDTVLWEQEGDDSYQYFYLDWYLMPRLLQKPCWTEPYNDLEETDDKVMDTGMIVSYCKPVSRPTASSSVPSRSTCRSSGFPRRFPPSGPIPMPIASWSAVVGPIWSIPIRRNCSSRRSSPKGWIIPIRRLMNWAGPCASGSRG